MTSQLSTIFRIPERSEATPGLWNAVYDQIDANFAAVDITNSLSTLSIGADLWLAGSELIGENPSYTTRAALKIAVRSDTSDYIYFEDSSAAKSDYLLGSRVGGTADGLNLYDVSGDTMIVSFSKQSIRFYQNVVGPVFDITSDFVNVATHGTGSDSTESRIQSALNQSKIDNKTGIYLPRAFYPYSASSISFIHTQRIVREGGDYTVFDIQAYGADPLFVRSATSSFLGAISGASQAGGGVVYMPVGDYLITAPGIEMPPTGDLSIVLKGESRRDTVLRPNASAITCISSGTSGVDTRYHVIENFTITGAFESAKTGCGIWMVRPHTCTVRDVNIEEFDGANGVALFVEGTQSQSPPHAWRNSFERILTATCLRGAVLRNADENSFYHCNFGLITGQLSRATALEILQGRNNRFYSTLVQGETASLTTGRPNYVGVSIPSPTTGDNQSHQFYGMVAEGFDSGVSIGSGVTHTLLTNYNASICLHTMKDQGLGTVRLQVYGTDSIPFFQWPSGTVASPAFAFSSEGSLGFYRSGASRIDLTGGASLYLFGGSSVTPGLAFTSARSTGFVDNGGPGMDIFVAGNVAFRTLTNSAAIVGGSAVAPSLRFTSEGSLGWYRSGTSTMALSYGTLLLNGPMWSTSGISVGTATHGGTLIPAISSISSLVAAFVVQPSASSFTVITWAAVRAGDQILTTVMQSGAVSSLSSGLILHSHCTQNGQIEFRVSNVSTLVQNQSSRSYFFTRVTPF